MKRYICLNEACSFEQDLYPNGIGRGIPYTVTFAKKMHEEQVGHRVVIRDSPDPDEVGVS